MRLIPRTLGMQLVAVTAAAVLLSNLAVVAWFELTTEQQNEAALMDRVVDRAASSAQLLSAIPAAYRKSAAETMSAYPWDFVLRNGNARSRPMNDDERRLAAKLRSELPAALARFPVLANLRDARRQAFQFVVPVAPGTELVATFHRPASTPWQVEALAAAMVAILAASLAAAYFARRFTRPLAELASAASTLARSGNAPRLNETGPQDVREAALAFNAMTDEVRRTLESQRQLLSAVGHDLRTPITAMRISLEFVSDPELRANLQKNLAELQELTEAVLSAARGTGGEAKRAIDLSSLLESLCADMDDQGEQVHFAVDDEPAPLVCRPNEIRRAVRNLVANAVAYGGRAEVRLGREDGAYEIVVEDQGPGIPEPDQQRVFEPFVRLESSRNEDTGGSGLGLTLVKAIAEGHGGSIKLENCRERGLRARLCLPRDRVAV
ncbi:MAG: HAMP domain-containing protein [Alphaproteobacteria bacterium]|nr:HAMP domain-containing protein [Alphaproteobacteria bacterium]MBV9692605.1 HAMP domain-containing protein [Alphaproteobacteria bacterium]